MVDTLIWATDCDSKALILRVGPRHIEGRRVRAILDVGSGSSEEIVTLCPGADAYYFLDPFALPPPRDGFHLLRQSVGEPFPLPDACLDVVSTNGSFDHFTAADRVRAFLEIERCLKPDGLLLFACEYFDFDRRDEHAFFQACASHPETLAMNCPAFSNIDLPAVLGHLSSLRICQQDLSQLPAGQPLRELVTPRQARVFTSSAAGLAASWGAFFVLFRKAGTP